MATGSEEGRGIEALELLREGGFGGLPQRRVLGEDFGVRRGERGVGGSGAGGGNGGGGGGLGARPEALLELVQGHS